MAAADVAGGRRWSGRRWRASVAGVGGGRRWRASRVAGGQQLSFARLCVFAIFDRPMDRGRCVQHDRSGQFRVWWAYARRACDAEMRIFVYGRRRQEQQGQRPPIGRVRRPTGGRGNMDRNPWWFDLQSRISETRKVQSCYVARRK